MSSPASASASPAPGKSPSSKKKSGGRKSEKNNKHNKAGETGNVNSDASTKAITKAITKASTKASNPGNNSKSKKATGKKRARSEVSDEAPSAAASSSESSAESGKSIEEMSKQQALLAATDEPQQPSRKRQKRAKKEGGAKGGLSRRAQKGKLRTINQRLLEHAKRKQLGMAFKEFQRLCESPDLQPSIHTYSTMINACVRCGEIDSALDYFEQMRAAGIAANVVIHTTLIKGLAQEGMVQRAYEMWDSEMCQAKNPEDRPNIRTCDTLLRGCVRWGAADIAMQVYRWMLAEGVSPTTSSFEYLIKSLCINLRLEEASMLALEMSEAGLAGGSNAYTNVALCAGLLGDFAQCRKAAATSEKVLKEPRKHQPQELSAGGGGGDDDDEPAQPRFFKSGPGQTGTASKHSIGMFDRFREQENKAELERVQEFLKLLDEEPSLAQHFRSVRARIAEGEQPGRFGLGDWRYPQVYMVDEGPIPPVHKLFERVRGEAGEAASDNNQGRPIVIEVGSGNGDWICRQAKDFPEKDWVAMELRTERCFEIWSKIEMTGLKNLVVVCGNAHKAFALHADPGTVEAVYINYPTPPVWIGGENKFIDSEFLWTIHRSLQSGGLLNMVTDDEPYCRQILHQIFQLRDLGAFESQVHFDNSYQHPKAQQQAAAAQQQSGAAGGKRRFLNNKQQTARSDGQVSTRELFTHVLPKEFLGRSSYFDRLFLNGRKLKRFFMSFKKHDGFERKYRRYINRYVIFDPSIGRKDKSRRANSDQDESFGVDAESAEASEEKEKDQDTATMEDDEEADSDAEDVEEKPAKAAKKAAKPSKQTKEAAAPAEAETAAAEAEASSKRKSKKRRGKKKKGAATASGAGSDEEDD